MRGREFNGFLFKAVQISTLGARAHTLGFATGASRAALQYVRAKARPHQAFPAIRYARRRGRGHRPW